MRWPLRRRSRPAALTSRPARDRPRPDRVHARVSGDAPTATVATATAPPAASGSAETDREALAAVYNATGGAPSLSKWLSDAPLSEWDGVKTDDDGRVIELDLNYNYLSGEIPAELGGFHRQVVVR